MTLMRDLWSAVQTSLILSNSAHQNHGRVRSRTLALVKPDAYPHLGKIIKEIYKMNFIISQMRMVKMTKADVPEMLFKMINRIRLPSCPHFARFCRLRAKFAKILAKFCRNPPRIGRGYQITSSQN